ncbi:hypothetical protein DSCO28_36510 [Desulfosarcina ovata subsp. sediminis]|uniref:Lipoprotein n=1 Tax=Desulfosarcina ovata subsp. sediminis TaxID=885957 RepID=A0A5K7ZS95_9BACT|nr:hypothetical protein [Desulfosarcina ovata]BBO83085.1 hypothetical protein DSCO28_36510 [Desulfosarcina ovata subsp. sediminis]
MKKSIQLFVTLSFILFLMTACATAPVGKNKLEQIQPALTSIDQIDSFNPELACKQGLEVINNNPYEQDSFEAVFAKIVEQCKNSSAPENADIIWEHFIVPLKQNGKVPPDLAKNLWNYYFSRQFVSLPENSPISQQCYALADIKKNIEREYQLKKAGFEICRQGNPDTHFLNAMYVYNTMWAACKGVD